MCRVFAGLLAFLAAAPLLAQPPRLVRDINTTPLVDPGSSPEGFVPAGAFTYFHAFTTATGVELFRTTGNPGGTRLVKDVNPGVDGSNPRNLTAVGNTLFFTATDPQHGTELWKTDGSDAGTVLVADIRSGGSGSAPASLTTLGTTVFLWADDGVSGRELWKSDGRSTTLVRDIRPGPVGSHFGTGNLHPWNGRIYFAADDGVNGVELWASDGTAQGTILVKDIHVGSLPSVPMTFASTQSLLFFTAFRADIGIELWTSDGTAQGTTLVKDIAPGNTSSVPLDLQVLGSKVLFTAQEPSTGRELWVSDGTATGTMLVADLQTGTGDTFFVASRVFGSHLYFTAVVGATPSLYRSDGTAAGTGVFSPSIMLMPEVVGGTLFFLGQTQANDGGLWKTDGTAQGTQPVRVGLDFELLAIGAGPLGQVLLTVRDPRHGAELWVSDGTTTGTVLLADIQPPPPGSDHANPGGLTELEGEVLFFADDGVHGYELWKSDGTPAGTQILRDIQPGPGNGGSSVATRLGRFLLFFADDGISGYELWRSDGTAQGTVLVKDIRPGPTGVQGAVALTVWRDRLYFITDDGTHGFEPWVSDGTSAGTFLLKDIRPGPESSFPSWQFAFMPFGDALLFSAAASGTDQELWKTDGTAQGTALVKDIRPGPAGSNPIPLGITPRGVILAAFDDPVGNEPWISDGTAQGTRMLLDGIPGPNGLIPTIGATVGDTVFFVTATTNPALWKTDGTTAGTVHVKDVIAGRGLFTGLRGKLLFAAFDPVSGNELWTSDGTAAGTYLLKDLAAGGMSSDPTELVRIGSRRLTITATNATSGRDLWLTDGTAAGTLPIVDLTPRASRFFMATACLQGGELYFPRDDGQLGTELWAWFPGATAQSIGEGCGGGRRRATIAAGDPVLGTTIAIDGSDAFPGALGAIVLGAGSRPSLVIGAGCTSYVALGQPFWLMQAFVPRQSTWSASLALPNDASLVGLRAMMQAWFLQTDARLGFETTNGMLMTLGR